ncbi:Nin one binding Zn-ribbon like-domain-containing protein [Gigaspora margarita]|uniref:Nin one binding Zn-ribbon like-domain-containing protein n=1 Tax=Gigaspora margarita TaxID=4874 RepID=A0A8H4AMQ3_GIGMA|nr:Nin one binding Zn-ribbon like-domain-containing protein [Gigaspora margarita]
MLDPNNLSTSEVSKQPKFKFLVVDSGPLIKGIDVRHLAEKVYTIPEVILEIRDKHSREFLTQISFDIETILPNGEALKEVVNFSKKTGDYTSLSAIDLRVMALTYMLEVQVNGTKRLRKEPVKSLTQFGGNNKNLKKAEIDTPVPQDDDDDDDEKGWITPDNIMEYQEKEQILSVKTKKDESVDIKVACMTTDYSMQNVLLQMGLNLVSVEGARIKKVKSWVLRCHACFKITTNMEKQFCPSCGGATLIRTSTSTDMNGKVTYYLKKNFQYNLRGTKYSIPNPKSGRNANNLILREDQKEYQKALKSHRKQKEVDIFDPDYVPKLFIGSGSSTSCGAPVIGYGRRNPNETTRGKGKGKKRR